MRKLLIAVVALLLLSVPAMAAEPHTEVAPTGSTRASSEPSKAQVDRALENTCAAYRKFKETESRTSANSFTAAPSTSSLGGGATLTY